MPCQICSIAVVAGVGLSRWLGIDDTISGIWIGALTMVLVLWTIGWLQKKKINIKGLEVITLLTFYAFIFIPLEMAGIIGHQDNKLWGADKLTFGFLAGSILLTCGISWYDYTKTKNGKPHFPFERVVAPVAPLVLLSFLFYFLTR